MSKSKVIYCYETKEKFNNTKEIANKYKIHPSAILKSLDNPNKRSAGYHWCTSLDIFDDINTKKNNIKIYCYETRTLFTNYKDIQDFVKKPKVSDILKVLDNPNKSFCKYHWCTDLSIFDDIKNELNISKNYKKEIFCYETKLKFNSLNKAAIFYNQKNGNNIRNVLDNPNRTACGFHWCTDLSLFDGVKLTSGNDLIKIPVYCYETKKIFDSYKAAADFVGLINSSSIISVLDNPNRVAGGYHWCTSLDIFKNVKLSGGKDLIKIPIYCYETKEKFESITQAADYIGFANGSPIGHVLDNPNRTAGNYHWCTSLDKFNPDDLVYPDSGISTQEKEIFDFIKSIYDGEVIENSRSIIYPYELDIYMPDLNLAFEFNGDYWHSEQAGKDKNYHLNKTNLCKDKDIQLIHIFEYQYRENPIIIKSMIMNKLNKNRIKLYARSCEVKLITNNNEVRNFLEENHIQGYVNSLINIGLYCNNVLVSIMTFGKSRFDKSIEYELLRYASLRSTNVIGGASKLLKYFEINYKPESLISYADISYSNGNLYNKLGFNYISTSGPDYVSIRNNIVYPRFNTMKHKLSKLLGEENFDINLTEQQNLDNNGFLRIWKCGNLKFLKEYNYNE